MGAPPLALSIHHFISSVGADAGFAAIIGLAILVLLFFAQARETTALRHHAEELMARIGELEARLARVAGAQAQAQAQAAASAAAVPESQPAVAAGVGSASIRLAALEMAPFPPAGVGAPALTAATRVIPAGVAARAAAARVPVGVGAGEGGAPPAPLPAPETVPSPGPATAAGGSNGSSHGPVAAPPYRVPDQRLQAPQRSGASPGAAPRRAPARPGAALPPHLAIRPERSLAGRIALAAIVVAVVAGVAVAVILLTQGGKSTPSSGRSAAASTPSSRTAKARSSVLVHPATVTVSVLNGTTRNGLAGKTLTQLLADGFRKGSTATANNQIHQTTVVYFLPGHRAAATAVAQKLGLATTAVQAIDSATRNVAFNSCSNPPCTADVVVLVGADLAGR